MRDGFEVTIAGGGVAGLAAALAFRKGGYPVTVVERAAAFGPVGAGILLQANGLLILDALGLGEEVRARGEAMPRFVLRDRRGRCLIDTALDEHLPPHLWPVCIHRARLHDILWQACIRAHVVTHFDCKASAVEGSGPSPVLVCDTPRGSMRLASNLIVGADGVNSAVRKAAGFAPHFWPVIEGSVQGVVPHSVPADLHGEYVGGSEACGMLPMGGNSTFWFWGGSSRAVAQVETLDFASWKDNVYRHFPAMRLVLDQHDDWSGTVRLRHSSVHCDAWSSGNVVLIGDAAHAMSPNLGQGANCAIVDALALVSRVAARNSDADLSDALALFEQDRRSMVDRLQRRGHDEGASVVRRWSGFEPMVNFMLRLVRFASPARWRADIRLFSGLDGEYLDLEAAGVRAPIPW